MRTPGLFVVTVPGLHGMATYIRQERSEHGVGDEW